MIRTTSIATRAVLIGTLMMAGATFAQQSDGAAGAYTKEVDGDFDDVAFALEQAITNEGLVIDSINYVGEMLARTKGDVGGAKDLYVAANTYNFCSAIVSRQAMEADIANIQYCPYGVFVYEAVAEPGKIVVGHRMHDGDEMAPVDELLSRIVNIATE